MTVKYEIAKQQLFSPHLGEYISFGIRALELQGEEWKEAAFVPDISPNRNFADMLAAACTKGALDPEQLIDVVSDVISC